MNILREIYKKIRLYLGYDKPRPEPKISIPEDSLAKSRPHVTKSYINLTMPPIEPSIYLTHRDAFNLIREHKVTIDNFKMMDIQYLTRDIGSPYTVDLFRQNGVSGEFYLEGTYPNYFQQNFSQRYHLIGTDYFLFILEKEWNATEYPTLWARRVNPNRKERGIGIYYYSNTYEDYSRDITDLPLGWRPSYVLGKVRFKTNDVFIPVGLNEVLENVHEDIAEVLLFNLELFL